MIQFLSSLWARLTGQRRTVLLMRGVERLTIWMDYPEQGHIDSILDDVAELLEAEWEVFYSNIRPWEHRSFEVTVTVDQMPKLHGLLIASINTVYCGRLMQQMSYAEQPDGLTEVTIKFIDAPEVCEVHGNFRFLEWL